MLAPLLLLLLPGSAASACEWAKQIHRLQVVLQLALELDQLVSCLGNERGVVALPHFEGSTTKSNRVRLGYNSYLFYFSYYYHYYCYSC